MYSTNIHDRVSASFVPSTSLNDSVSGISDYEEVDLVEGIIHAQYFLDTKAFSVHNPY